ncbi:MAG TPA: dihydroorotate dehydrogenase [Clostridia bacterium]|nr:dihydroorotate dehydrogenase [Clostridia bacterium]
MNLGVNICGIHFKNPIIAASGTYGFGREYDRIYDISVLGGIAVKGLTLKARAGNPPPRIAETPSGILNSVGLQNPGVEHFIRHDLPWLIAKNIPVIANIAGSTVEEYCEITERLSDSSISMLELNVSCPNVREGGVTFGTDKDMLARVVSSVKKFTRKPLCVKLSPNVTDIAEMAYIAQDCGAGAVSLINTLTGMAIDAVTRKPILANITGGLSGPAVKPIALRMVWQTAKRVKIPVIGMGGIMTATDVVEFLLAGASVVMVGTANIANPNACPEIIEGLKEYMDKYNVRDVNELVGGMLE